MAEDFFAPWVPGPADECDPAECCPYDEASPPLALPSAGGAPVPLQRFQATSVAGSPGEQPAGSDDGRDALFFAGGPVWALDWCPALAALPASAGLPAGGARGRAAAAAGGAPGYLQAQYLAVGCHPARQPEHVIGRPVAGPAALQVWEVVGPPGAAGAARGAGAAPLPRLALGIAHDGGLAWQARWCPDAGLAGAGADGSAALRGRPPRLGLLAAALGDGSVRVWAVPAPRTLPGGAPGHAAPFLRLPACANLQKEALGGSLPSALDWLPSAPHDLLLIGCWDGMVALAKLTPSQQRRPAAGRAGTPHASGLQLLQRFPAEAVPLRSVRFVPQLPRPGSDGGGGADPLGRHVFLTAGHEGTLKIWDSRDEYAPQYATQLSSSAFILDAAWTTDPLGMFASLEDASIRGVAVGGVTGKGSGPVAATWRSRHLGAMWALAVHAPSQTIAYAGEDGLVCSFRAELGADARKREQHAVLSGLCAEGDDVLHVLPSRRPLERKVVERMSVVQDLPVPPGAQALHRVAWSAGGASGAWLAAGGAAGLVRLQWQDL